MPDLLPVGNHCVLTSEKVGLKRATTRIKKVGGGYKLSSAPLRPWLCFSESSLTGYLLFVETVAAEDAQLTSAFFHRDSGSSFCALVVLPCSYFSSSHPSLIRLPLLSMRSSPNTCVTNLCIRFPCVNNLKSVLCVFFFFSTQWTQTETVSDQREK